jgi:hypothetical protein
VIREAIDDDVSEARRGDADACPAEPERRMNPRLYAAARRVGGGLTPPATRSSG